jgi:di/tricarboxylate transporter
MILNNNSVRNISGTSFNDKLFISIAVKILINLILVHMKEIKITQTLITFAIGIVIWLIPAPTGVSAEAWHLFAIFVATIIGIILKAAPMGTMCMIAIAITAFLQILAPGDPENQSHSL